MLVPSVAPFVDRSEDVVVGICLVSLSNADRRRD
jgi:hypothetical protein